MSRRRGAQKRNVEPDVKYQSQLLGRFINKVMKKGKKRLAESIVYNALDQVGEKTSKEGLAVFKKAIENVKPVLEVKSRRIGGANYQVPMEVSPERRTALAIRWIIGYSGDRKGRSMSEKLAGEIVDASNNEGSSIRKKIEMHKMAEANRAFAHFGW